MLSAPSPTMLPPYTGELTPVDAANAIRAARLNALDLLDTAEMLYTLKRFAHSMAFSTLAIEESSKQLILMSILCAQDQQQRSKSWRSYRSHQAKTQDLNRAIEGRIRVTFPRISRDDAKNIGENGPSPKELEYNKQLAVYSDCVEESGAFVSHYPALSEWRRLSWDRLCEAQSLVLHLRDRTPEELAIFQKHFKQGLKDLDPRVAMQQLRDELLEKGCIKEGWWDTMLEDIDHELSGSS